MSDQTGSIVSTLIVIVVFIAIVLWEVGKRKRIPRPTPQRIPATPRTQPIAPPPTPEAIEANKVESPVDFSHPANEGILRYLMGAEFRGLPSIPPFEDYYDGVGGTHPDLVEILWERMSKPLPEKCAWVVYGRPALVHKSTGIVFGFAVGTSLIGLRLPEQERQRVIGNNSHSQKWQWGSGKTVFARDIGKDWIFVNLKDQEQNCLRAYEYAAQILPPS